MLGRFMFRFFGAAEDFTRILIVMPVLIPKRACQEESQLQGIARILIHMTKLNEMTADHSRR